MGTQKHFLPLVQDRYPYYATNHVIISSLITSFIMTLHRHRQIELTRRREKLINHGTGLTDIV